MFKVAGVALTHARDTLGGNTLEQPHIEAHLVPFNRSTGDLNEREADRRLPVLGGLKDEVVQRRRNAGILTIISV